MVRCEPHEDTYLGIHHQSCLNNRLEGIRTNTCCYLSENKTPRPGTRCLKSSWVGPGRSKREVATKDHLGS